MCPAGNHETVQEGLLWMYWLATQARLRKKTVLIDAGKDTSWTAEALTEASFRFSNPLLRYGVGERIAFRLPNGPEWFAFFLQQALQRSSLAAVPLDGEMPEGGMPSKSLRRLRVRTLYLDGAFHSLDGAASRGKRLLHQSDLG